MKERVLLIMVLMVLMVAVAACAAPQPSTPAPAPTATTGEPIIIGVASSLGYPHGEEGLAAVEMAVEEVNAGGGVSLGGVKHPFKVESIDDRSGSPGVPASDSLMAWEKLILEKKPVAVMVGPYRSEVLLAGMDLLYKYKTPMIVSDAMSPTMETKVVEDYDKYKYAFRVCHNSVYLADAIVQQFIYLQNEYGFSKTYIINEDAAWANGTVGLVQKGLEGTGWEVVGHDVTPLAATDYSSSLLSAKEASAETITVVFSMPETASMVKQMYDMETPALLMGYHSFLAPGHMWETLDGKLAYSVVTAGELGLVPSEKDSESIAFFDKFKARIGHWPDADHCGASSYDSVYILGEAIERAGSLDSEKLIPYLEATDYMGVSGRMKFSPGHQVYYGNDPYEASCEVTFQWIDGKRVPVLPEAIAEGKIQLPPWMK